EVADDGERPIDLPDAGPPYAAVIDHTLACLTGQASNLIEPASALPALQLTLDVHQRLTQVAGQVARAGHRGRPRRNGSNSVAEERGQPRQPSPLNLSPPRSAACPWLRSAGTGQPHCGVTHPPAAPRPNASHPHWQISAATTQSPITQP